MRRRVSKVLGGFLLVWSSVIHADLIVYDNTSENSFDQSCSFGSPSDVDFANTSLVHSPSNSIRFTPDDFNGVGWCSPSEYSAISDHAGIDFWIYLSGDTGEGELLALVLADAGSPVASQSLQTIYGSPIATGTWVEIRAEFAAAPMNYGGSFDQVYLQDLSGATQASVYLDDVALVGPDRIFGDAFEIPETPFTVGANVSMGNGTITPASQSVDEGGRATFSVTTGTDHLALVEGDTCTVAQIGTSTTWASSTITQDCAVSAAFVPKTVNLVLTSDGTGSGSITPSPVGTSCGTGCYTYDYGTPVTITASPSPGSSFTGWSGAGCSGTGTCPLTMTGNTSVSAAFSLSQYILTVSESGSGTGTVTSNVGGINCGATCSANFNYGTIVNLNAMAAPGSTFIGWSGGGCSGTNSCIITVTAATAVNADFSSP